MGKKLVYEGVVCDKCLHEGRLEDAAISHWESLLDGTFVDYCDNGHIHHWGQCLYHVVWTEKIGCTIRFADLFDVYGRPVIKREHCRPLLDMDGNRIRERLECGKCPFLERHGCKGTMKPMYQQFTMPIREKDTRGLDPKKLLHRHSRWGKHSIMVRHKRQPDKRDSRFENYEEFLQWLKWFGGVEIKSKGGER